MKKPKASTRSAKFLFEELDKDPKHNELMQIERAKSFIAQNVRELRLKAGLTQSELATRAQTTQAVISRIELGTDSRLTSIDLLRRIAAACGAQLNFSFDLIKKKAA